MCPDDRDIAQPEQLRMGLAKNPPGSPVASGQDSVMETPSTPPLEEGEVYVCRRGRLERIERDADDMRKIRITDEAYQATMHLGKGMRSGLVGYKPDVALIASALVIVASRDPDQARATVRDFVLKMFREMA